MVKLDPHQIQTIKDGIAAIGAKFDANILQQTRSLYRSAVQSAGWANRPVITDVAYGPHERQRLDVFPADEEAAAPLLLFVHGGGFIGGDKGNDPPFYSNIGRYFADAGFCPLLMNYRLAQTDPWPAGAEDVAFAISWAIDYASTYGGDPTRVLLLGQSAGASHCATYLFDERISGVHRDRIKAAALLSGFYQAEPPLSGGPLQYFGPDEEHWPDMSPSSHVSRFHPPLLLSVAEFDPAEIAEQTLIFARALNNVDGRPPRLVWLEGENHVSGIHGLGIGGDPVGQLLRSFFEDVQTGGHHDA
jgi:triacylglycerol lipase